jgi:ABC-2 type transport system permease protein
VSARRVAAVARRIAQGFRRDHRSLALLIVAPLLVTALLGWVLRDQKDTTAHVAIVNQAGDAGQRIVDAMSKAAAATPDDVAIALTTADPAAASDAIRNETADVAILIPSTLVSDVLAGRAPVFTIVTGGTDPVSDGGRLGAVQKLLAGAAKELAPPGAAAIVPEIRRETVYLSPDADQLDVLAPVFLGLFAYFFVFILTGISFLRERIGGTLERLLATPVTRAEIVLGYSLGFGLFATIQVLILTLFVLSSLAVPSIGPIPAFTIGLGVQSTGSPLFAFVIALLLAIGAVNLGIFLSTFARTELQVVQFIPLVILPQALLGGVFWPVERLPDVLQAIARVLPVTYAVDALREVMIKGADLSAGAVQLDLAVLAGIALFFVAIASATIKREVT